MSVSFAELGDVADVNWGNTSITKASYSANGFPAFSATGCDGFLPNFEHDSAGVILSAIGAKCGKCFWANGKWTAIKNTITITPHGKRQADLKFLFYYLNREGVWPRRGMGQPFIGLGDARKVSVPLLPLAEQRRIAEVLDRAEALRAKRRAALAQLDALTQSAFVDLFGDPSTNPKGWDVTRFGVEIGSVRYGTGSPPKYVKDGVPFIRATNVKNGTISSKDLVKISGADAERLAKCRVNFGNLIVVRSGVNTGDCAMVPRLYDGACAAFDLIVELSLVNSVFYNFLINSPYGKRHLAPLTRRAAQPHLNADQLRSLEFISPPKEKKEEFERCIVAVEKLRTAHRTMLMRLDALFAVLQHRAFRGEL